MVGIVLMTTGIQMTVLFDKGLGHSPFKRQFTETVRLKSPFTSSNKTVAFIKETINTCWNNCWRLVHRRYLTIYDGGAHSFLHSFLHLFSHLFIFPPWHTLWQTSRHTVLQPSSLHVPTPKNEHSAVPMITMEISSKTRSLEFIF